MSDSAIPQWKKDLIARLRSQNKRTAHAEQLLIPSSAVQQPVAVGREKCECATMVQERSWGDKSDSDEDLHYGPGIVSKLKERYLSLAEREKPRPSILRKAASLENILDDGPVEQNRLFQPSQNKNVPNRYANRGSQLKRARSVETISSTEERETKEPKRESLHEEMLISNRGSLIIPEKPTDNGENKFTRVNRPKRIAPVMNEKEKPPADVVKQAKMIFERRPEQRTRAPQQTGEVAAKVATYKNIIIQNKPLKKPAIKVKPVIGDKPKANGITVKTKSLDRDLPTKSFEKKSVDEKKNDSFRPKSPEKKHQVEVVQPKSPERRPAPEVIRPKSPEKKPSAEVTPPKSPEKKPSAEVTPPKSPEKKPPVEMIIRPKSPLEKKISLDIPLSPKSPEKKVTGDVPEFPLSLSSPKSPERTTSLPSPIPDISRVDIKVEENGVNSTSLTETPDLIITSSPLASVNSPSFRISATENFIKEEIKLAQNNHIPEGKKTPSPSNSMTFNFAQTSPKTQNHLPINKNVLNTQTPPSQPLKLEINGVNETKKPSSTNHTPTGQILVSAKPALTTLEIEKNLINAAKSGVKKSGTNEVTVVKVSKVKKPPRELENNSVVFNFRDRKDVPDYVHDDGVKRVAKLEKPKVGEGGIILLPGASVGESFTDEDDEILESLKGPPSPCDVTFINDNILIDGKSSLSQKAKKPKMKISFLEGPEVYEYPSESSLVEDTPTSPPVAQIRHLVPSVTGSTSLASYTPKSTEEFQPGISRSVQSMPITKPEIPDTNDVFLQEVEKPIMFSAGANTDILF